MTTIVPSSLRSEDRGCTGPEKAANLPADVEADIERILAMTDEECLAAGIAEYGSEEAYRTAMNDLRDRMIARAEATIAAQAPTPDPAVMRDYIVKLTAFFIDNPQWVALAEEARGYVGALSEKKTA